MICWLHASTISCDGHYVFCCCSLYCSDAHTSLFGGAVGPTSCAVVPDSFNSGSTRTACNSEVVTQEELWEELFGRNLPPSQCEEKRQLIEALRVPCGAKEPPVRYVDHGTSDVPKGAYNCGHTLECATQMLSVQTVVQLYLTVVELASIVLNMLPSTMVPWWQPVVLKIHTFSMFFLKGLVGQPYQPCGARMIMLLAITFMSIGAAIILFSMGTFVLLGLNFPIVALPVFALGQYIACLFIQGELFWLAMTRPFASIVVGVPEAPALASYQLFNVLGLLVEVVGSTCGGALLLKFDSWRAARGASVPQEEPSRVVANPLHSETKPAAVP